MSRVSHNYICDIYNVLKKLNQGIDEVFTYGSFWNIILRVWQCYWPSIRILPKATVFNAAIKMFTRRIYITTYHRMFLDKEEKIGFLKCLQKQNTYLSLICI